MALKKKAPPAGAPEWVLTYGDMMSLLLCFFILLAAFADFEKGGSSSKAILAIASIQQALGVKLSGNVLQNAAEFNALIERLKTAIKELQTRNRGDASENGLKGKAFRLRKVRDGMEITIGGPILCEPFSAALNADGRQALSEIGHVLKGHRNMVEIRGHAGEGAETSEWTYNDAIRLSHERAAAVAGELIAAGIDRRTLRLVAAGDNEPLASGATGQTAREDSRRVEIIVRESLLDDFRAEGGNQR